MEDFSSSCRQMVDKQIISRRIKDERVIKAMFDVPRHKFIPAEKIDYAYEDHPLPIGEGQTISQPYIVALMTECLKLKGEERVLEIGTGSGYQTAVLAELAKEVYSVERFPSLAEEARVILDELGYKNVNTKCSDGSLGWKEFSPYDCIIVTAASPDIPPPLIEQLKEGGILVIPLGENHFQVLSVVRKFKGKIETEQVCSCVFVPLVGEYGWKD